MDKKGAINNRPHNLVHWADMTADRVIKQKGDKDCYTLASGITPSGVVHFGNFREVITVDFLARAFRSRGKKVRFIFSWDDYDTFRKIPANLPKQEELKEYLFRPIVDTPDPFEKAESYAAYHQKNFENELKVMGIDLEPLYQARKYRALEYRAGILRALKNRDRIAEILNQHRTTALDKDWWPLSVYCHQCQTDHKTKIDQVDLEKKTLSYHCDHCQHSEQLDLDNAPNLKLPWRIDWPMRWAYEKVDFEPGGKDHSSQGGSFSTAKDIVKVFDWEAPAYLQYDFVSIKGAGGKMSSSKGNLVTVSDVLNVYTPEMVRWIFASYKSNVDFAVSFDLDVIKTYEDFDRQERLAYGLESGNEKKQMMAKRVFELSSLTEQPLAESPPFRPSFRHLTNILQIHSGNIENAREYYQQKYPQEMNSPVDLEAFDQRAKCALYWLEHYAPEDFKFSLNSSRPSIELSEGQEKFVADLAQLLEEKWEELTSDKELHERMFEILHRYQLEPAQAFGPLYQILISKEKGPKLAGFILTIGKDKVLRLIG